ncbi:hypothetical protein PV10_07452 [Exophiala mesophila]|uniref:Pre-mRNA-splicing factor cwc26 n=1 Tax=Exophiala mesophila TaxID=212818 RepID=A0A0D1XPS9_EXOME|nr:uncharacterized protein PV10_07452 [Exophiala mesophila]KIV90111.1 hypothetical protein PV10_07452 [Exophiala mesophila]
MAPANLADYLAKNYLNASSSTKSASDPNSNSDFLESSRPKKKRRKNKDPNSENTGLLIADDDADLTLRTGGSSRRKGNDDDDDDNDTPIYATSAPSAEFRKKKTTSWKVIDAPSNTNANTDDAEAERIISEAAAESAARRREIDDEDAPAVVDIPQETSQPRMQSGARAGLQTAADTARLEEEEQQRRAAEEAQVAEEKRKSRKSKKKHDGDDDVPEEEQTIYRDATGRRIDLTLKRAEARRAELEKIAAEKKAREDAMGDVQRRQKEERKQELEDAKFLTLGRSADDHDMNEQLKTVVRWDDPMAAYMASKRAEEGDDVADGDGRARNGKGAVTKGGKTKTVQKKVYQGSAPPNRYGILPGWRWDGVDRGNGFEKEWFQARGRKARNEDLSYQWQMDE